jgi:2,3-bisphosphoglycerate-independent phosphoglycerate mutase
MNDRKKNKDKLVVLVTLDGWGAKGVKNEDIFSLAKTPNIDKNISSFPSTTLNLRKNTNDFFYEKDLSEFGYYCLGVGREDYKNLSRIDKLIENKKFYKNKTLIKAIDNTKKHGSKLHVMGLLSEAKKYSSLNHLKELLKLIKREGVEKTYLHLILDGVDTPPQAGLNLIKEIKELIKKDQAVKIVTVSGRFYAMDRNYFWEWIFWEYTTFIIYNTSFVSSIRWI